MLYSDRRILQRPPNSLLLMLWTAPTLRHRGAIGWLHRSEPLEGSRPWAKLSRSACWRRTCIEANHLRGAVHGRSYHDRLVADGTATMNESNEKTRLA